MDIVNRIKNILVSPKTEWPVIEAEETPHVKLFTNYVVPLALIPAVASFLGWGLFWRPAAKLSAFVNAFAEALGESAPKTSYIGIGIRHAITQYVVMLAGVYLTAFVIDFLAEKFGARKDLNRAFALVAYAYTPMFIGGIFYLWPPISWLASLAGLYGLYLLYIGVQPMMKNPAEKQNSYFVVSLIVTIVVSALFQGVMSFIL